MFTAVVKKAFSKWFAVLLCCTAVEAHFNWSGNPCFGESLHSDIQEHWAEITMRADPFGPTALLCFNYTVGFPLFVPVLGWLLAAEVRPLRASGAPTAGARRQAAVPAEAGSAARPGTYRRNPIPLGSTPRANPFTEGSDLFCRLPLPAFF